MVGIRRRVVGRTYEGRGERQRGCSQTPPRSLNHLLPPRRYFLQRLGVLSPWISARIRSSVEWFEWIFQVHLRVSSQSFVADATWKMLPSRIGRSNALIYDRPVLDHSGWRGIDSFAGKVVHGMNLVCKFNAVLVDRWL